MSGVRCPRCGNTDASTIWEDNFWSGCNKCGWSASCENAVWVRDPKQPGVLVDGRNTRERDIDYAAWRKRYGYDVDLDEE